MNALQYALMSVKEDIPEVILKEAYSVDDHPAVVNLTSLDDKILNKTIRKRVMLEANIVGGVQLIIPLHNIQPSYYENNYTVYMIPPELTMNRAIVSVLGLSTLPVAYGFDNAVSSDAAYGATHGTNGGFGVNQGNALLNIGQRIGDSASMSAIMHNAHCELVAHNTVAVYAHYRTIGLLGLRVNVENDSNLSNIQPRSYDNFGILCRLAVRAYIYRKLVIEMNNGYLNGGQDLGVFKNIVDSYSNAEEEYMNFKKNVWAKVAFMNDSMRHTRFLTSMLAPDI